MYKHINKKCVLKYNVSLFIRSVKSKMKSNMARGDFPDSFHLWFFHLQLCSSPTNCGRRKEAIHSFSKLLVPRRQCM